MSEPIMIFLVDDHKIVRQGVRAFLDAQPDLHVVAEAESGDEALLLLQEIIPDVALVDLLMPGMSGIETIRQIRQISPRTQIMVLTSSDEDEHIFPALRAGACSYTLKDIRLEELVEGIRKAASGEAFLHPRVAARLIQEMRETKRRIPATFAHLTERELDVLRLIAEGHSNASIANKLSLSDKTVKGHVSNILNKLQVEDRTQIAILAWQKGLMEKDS